MYGIAHYEKEYHRGLRIRICGLFMNALHSNMAYERMTENSREEDSNGKIESVVVTILYIIVMHMYANENRKVTWVKQRNLFVHLCQVFNNSSK